MQTINLLAQDTIDKIAAGEVIERPASIVKELVENAIDAGANAVTVEIKEGGISFIRITDNGEGIPKDQVAIAFLRHATSKIRQVEDLLSIGSLGFRGEALSSIAAVCQVELITKTAGSLTGVRYLIEGGKEKGVEEIGAPEGSTFLVRNIFYNTPARKKFLKSPTTEAGYVSDLMEHLALSHPEVSFKFINNGQTRLHTSGNCNLKDIIYSIYGRDIASNLVEIGTEQDGIKITGYIGKPVISRGNRNFENYFVNGRYVKSSILSKAIEEGYKTFMMQHRYPFTVLRFELEGSMLDINVHPTKMELRFADNAGIYQLTYETVKNGLTHRELIPKVTLDGTGTHREPAAAAGGAGRSGAAAAGRPEAATAGSGGGAEIAGAVNDGDPAAAGIRENENAAAMAIGGVVNTGNPATDGTDGKSEEAVGPEGRTIPKLVGKKEKPSYPEPFEKVRRSLLAESVSPYQVKYPQRQTGGWQVSVGDKVLTQGGGMPRQAGDEMGRQPEDGMPRQAGDETVRQPEGGLQSNLSDTPLSGQGTAASDATHPDSQSQIPSDGQLRTNDATLEQPAGKPVQLELFEDKLLDKKNVQEHRLIGQIFDTYWIVQFRDNLYIIDQHAAHEKVMYERLCSSLENRRFTTQLVSPPIILTLSLQEENLLKKYQDIFEQVGFEIEHFGGREYSICGVPDNLFGITEQELFIEMLDSLSETTGKPTATILNEKLATMACKSAVKGNNRLSVTEANALIQELLNLENPYNCPHGRPTIISMSKYELEKKFKRIV